MVRIVAVARSFVVSRLFLPSVLFHFLFFAFSARSKAPTILSILTLLLAPHLQAQTGCPTTPSWSECVAGTLAVDAGGSWGQIDFEDVTYQPPPTLGSLHASPRSGCTPKDWLFYDSILDHYHGNAPPHCTSYGACGTTNDQVHIWSEENTRHVLFKNVTVKNAFRSNALQHMDNLQTYKAVDFGGWIVLQDSTFMNSDDENLQLGSLNSTGTYWNDSTTCESTASMGGLVLQNVTIAQEAAFISDCLARKGGGYCGGVNGIQATNPIAVWLINITFSSGTFSIYETGGPIVLIGSVPTAIGWTNRFDGRRYYYDSIEEALAATHASCLSLPSNRRPDGCNATDFPHTRPPFINLSTSGWANAGADTNPPAPPGSLRIIAP